MPKLSRLAYENGIPVVATNDSHMAKRDETDKLSFVRSLRFAKWHEATDIDKEEYIKDNTALAEALSKCGIPGSSIEIALKNIKWIADKCTCDYFDDRDYYPKYRDESGNIVKDSATLLRRFAAEGIAKRYKPGEFTEQYRQRMEYELNTIDRARIRRLPAHRTGFYQLCQNSCAIWRWPGKGIRCRIAGVLPAWYHQHRPYTT